MGSKVDERSIKCDLRHPKKISGIPLTFIRFNRTQCCVRARGGHVGFVFASDERTAQMVAKPGLWVAASFAGLAFFLAGLILGQEIAPTDYKLVQEQVLAAIDLAREIDNVENRELRVSRATLAPSGHIGLHSHHGDPTIVYVLGGVLTNHHDDGTTEEFRTGQVFAEFGPRSQWLENKGPRPVTFIAANIHRRD